MYCCNMGNKFILPDLSSILRTFIIMVGKHTTVRTQITPQNAIPKILYKSAMLIIPSEGN